MKQTTRFLSLFIIFIFLVGCGNSTTGGTGAKVGSRPTATPTTTATPTHTATPTQTPLPPTATFTLAPDLTIVVPTETATSAAPTATPTLVPTPVFPTVRFENPFLQTSFDLPDTWVVDDNFEDSGIIQVADTSETLFSGSVRRGALITVIGLPDVTDNLTEWVTLVTRSFNDNYLADDGATSLFTPVIINGYEGLRLEQKGSYTVVDPPEPVTLKIVALRHNGWVITIATGTVNDGLNRGGDEFEWLVNSIDITAPEPADDN